jgi:hypothetical protein
MRKGLIATLALILVLGLVGYSLGQQAPPAGRQGPGPGQHQMGPQGSMGPGTGMGPGMMGQMEGQGMWVLAWG